MVVVTADHCQTPHCLERAVEGTVIPDHRGRMVDTLQAAAKLSSIKDQSSDTMYLIVNIPGFPGAGLKQQYIDPTNMHYVCLSMTYVSYSSVL